MKSLIKITTFIAIIWILIKAQAVIKKPETNGVYNVEIKSISVGYNPEVKATVEKPVEPQVVEQKPQVNAVKTDEITDGVWEWRDLIAKYFPADQVQNALKIASAENGSGNPETVSKANSNGTRDYGLFQINSCHSELVDGNLDRFKDAETNVQVAAYLYNLDGWKIWSTHSKVGL